MQANIVECLMGLRRALAPIVMFGLLVGCGGGDTPESDPVVQTEPVASEKIDPPQQPPAAGRDPLELADLLVETGEFDQAAEILVQQLVADPASVEVLFRLANVRAAQGDLAEAVELLSSIPADHPEAGIPALGQSADWLSQLQRYNEAVDRYLLVIEQIPDASMARRRVAQLLNRQGRRHEAAEQLRELCKRGDIRQDELHALIVLSDAMVGDPVDPDSGEVDYTPIGASGEARKLFTEHRYAEAVAALRETVEAGNVPPAVMAFYGRAVAEAQDDAEFLRWIARTDDSVRQYSEYWSAIAAYLSSQREYEAAARASLEALDRDPTDFRSMNRLHLMMKLLGRTEDSETWEQRWKTYKQVLTANNAVSDSSGPNVEAMDELAAQLFAIGRRLEAVLWKSVESHYRGLPRQTMGQWNLQRQQLVANKQGFPDRDTRICGMSLDSFPLPDVAALKSSDVPIRAQPALTESEPHVARFQNVADQIGLTHAFRPATTDLPAGFTMYHQTGGGAAVLDYDCDGNPDLYLAQGSADPPEFRATQPNLLYRNQRGQLVDVTRQAGASELHYTIGCTAGDWNQDGFPDLVTANIGTNNLWINNGDGTFTAHPLPGTDNKQRMPASVAIADLSGDGIPDMFELSYLQDEKIAMLPERNAQGDVIEAVGPADFSPVTDRIGINDGRGGISFAPISDQPDAAHHGLGVVIANFDGRPGNDVFVGNDKSVNQMWVRDSETDAWSDVALVNGTAFSYGGAETASMGIASGDFDNNGDIDLHITNFQNESVCLYLGRDGLYQDRAAQFRLGFPSQSVLGFGSQAIDYDNNGLADLVVTNGHIDDYQVMSGPFRQLPQLFCNLGDRFEQVAVEDPTGYWASGHVGRTLARLDFDRDGQNDFVVTHLNETSALMLNQTEASNHWLQVQLVGVDSERDAVGASVRIESGNRRTTEWLVGGDGYLCRNEAIVSFGLADASRVDRLEIEWPSGETQSFTDIAADQRIVVVEHESLPFTLDAEDN